MTDETIQMLWKLSCGKIHPYRKYLKRNDIDGFLSAYLETPITLSELPVDLLDHVKNQINAYESLPSRIKYSRRSLPPKLDLSYYIEIDCKQELPFIVGVLADLSGQTEPVLSPLGQRTFIEIDRDNFDEVMSQIRPRLSLLIPNHLAGGDSSLTIELDFWKMDEFEPAHLVQQVPILKQLLDSRLSFTQSHDPDSNAKLTEIDGMLTRQLREILHHPDFQRLEASWLGLRYLLDETEIGELLKLRVLNVSKLDLINDSRNSVEFSRSELFKKVYAETILKIHGLPFGLLVGDYEFDHQSSDMELLKWIAKVAAFTQVPFVAAAASRLFNLNRYNNMEVTCDLSSVLTGTDHAEWNQFRTSDEAGYVGLTLPRVLGRLPYQSKVISTNNVRSDMQGCSKSEFKFNELAGIDKNENYLWMNATWAFAARVTNVCDQHSWFELICGQDNGGKVEGLPARWISTCDQKAMMLSPLEIDITARWQKQLCELGLVPIVFSKETAATTFIRTASCYQHQGENDASNYLIVELNHMLSALRFVQTVTMMVQDQLTDFRKLEDCLQWLTTHKSELVSRLDRWVKNFVVLDPQTLSLQERNQYPLAEAEVLILPKLDNQAEFQLVVSVSLHLSNGQTTPRHRFVSAIPFVHS